MFAITSLYAGLAALMLLGLSIHVIRGRMKHHVALLDGGVEEMSWRIRAHANFCEYVPFILLLLALAEAQNISSWLLHMIGMLMLMGRIFHAWNMLAIGHKNPGNYTFRVIGMQMTLAAMLVGAVCALYVALAVVASR